MHFGFAESFSPPIGRCRGFLEPWACPLLSCFLEPEWRQRQLNLSTAAMHGEIGHFLRGCDLLTRVGLIAESRNETTDFDEALALRCNKIQ